MKQRTQEQIRTHMFKLDDIDFAIIKVLSEDARKTYEQIADEIGRPYVCVKRRIKQMEDFKIIKGYCVEIDWERIVNEE